MKSFALWLALIETLLVVNTLDYNYHDHDSLEQFLNNITRRYPAITRLHSIGKSVDGTNLWVIVIGENASDHVTLRPQVKYIGNMHGNEPVGREVLLHFVEFLVDSYDVNKTITDFLKTTTVHIMPTMNPDGFQDSQEGDCMSVVGRYNRRGMDLNRNFPDFYHGNNAIIQPETQAVITWLHQQQFVLSANFHGGSLVANYPLDNFRDRNDPESSKSPDNQVLRHLSLAYSRTHPTMHLGLKCFNYSDEDSFKDGITNGAEWYPLAGGMQDYNYLYVGCMELTLEISCCKYPMAAELQSFWHANKEPLLAYLQQVHIGVKGLVMDENNNVVPGAFISVVGREDIVYKTSKYGDYWRLLLPGSYVLKVSVAGYKDVKTSFSVKSGEVTRLDINLTEKDRTVGNDASRTRTSSVWTVAVSCTMAVLLVHWTLRTHT